MWLHEHPSAVISVGFTGSTGHTQDTPVGRSSRAKVATWRNRIGLVTCSTTKMLLLPLMQNLNTPLYVFFSWDFKEGQVKEWFWGAYWLGNSLSFINLYLEEGGRAGGNSALS